jgi:hypothetical protein
MIHESWMACVATHQPPLGKQNQSRPASVHLNSKPETKSMQKCGETMTGVTNYGHSGTSTCAQEFNITTCVHSSIADTVQPQSYLRHIQAIIIIISFCDCL